VSSSTKGDAFESRVYAALAEELQTRLVLHDGLLLCSSSTDSGTLMPTESEEESISSLKLTSGAGLETAPS
jgi:hypothetical protein